MSYKEKHAHNTQPRRSILQTAPKASLIMLFSGLFLLLIITAISVNSANPTENATISAPAVLFVACVIGGVFCGTRFQSPQKYACAAVSSFIIISLLLLAKLFIYAPQDRTPFSIAIALHLVTFPAVMLGTAIVGKFPKKRRRKKSKYRS